MAANYAGFYKPERGTLRGEVLPAQGALLDVFYARVHLGTECLKCKSQGLTAVEMLEAYPDFADDKLTILWTCTRTQHLELKRVQRSGPYVAPHLHGCASFGCEPQVLAAAFCQPARAVALARAEADAARTAEAKAKFAAELQAGVDALDDDSSQGSQRTEHKAKPEPVRPPSPALPLPEPPARRSRRPSPSR